MLYRPLEDYEEIIQDGNFFTRILNKNTGKDNLHFNRLNCEIFCDELLELAKNVKDVQWMLEQITGCLMIACEDWREDIIRENPDREEELEDFEPYIEVSV